jgi:phage terminase large subunit
MTDYAFKVDPLTQRVTPKLNDKDNHVIDSLRYATEGLRAPVIDDWMMVTD